MASLIGFERYMKDAKNLKIVQTIIASTKSKMLAARIPSEKRALIFIINY